MHTNQAPSCNLNLNLIPGRQTSTTKNLPKIKPIIFPKIALKSRTRNDPKLRKNHHLPDLDLRYLLLSKIKHKSRLNSSRLVQSKSILNLSLSSLLEKPSQAKQILQKQQFIRTLHLKLCLFSSERLKQSLQILTHSLKKSRYLTNLDLEFGRAILLSPLHIRKLSSLLQTMHNLTALTIRQFTQNHITGNTLPIFLKAIQKLPSLSTLKLNLCNAFIDDQQIESLHSSLRDMKSLAYLDLHFQLCVNLRNEEIKKLVIICKDLGLVSCQLNLYVTPSVDEAKFYKDFDTVLMENNPKSLPFDLSIAHKYSGVTQTTVIKFSLNDDPTTKKSQHFYVRFHQIDDSKAQKKENIKRELQLNLPALKYLKTFSLNCFSYYGTAVNLSSALAFYLPKMESLDILTLDFEANSGLQDYSLFNKALENLHALHKLKTLDLRFYDFNLSNKQTKHFCSCISKVKTLKSLSLDFRNDQVSVFETLTMIDSTESLNKLVKLSLAFTSKNFVYSKENQFKGSFRGLRKLKYLSIKLKNVALAIEEQKALSRSFYQIISLNQVHLELNYHEDLLQQNLKYFEEIVGHAGDMDCWITLSVHFYNSRNQRTRMTPVYNIE